MGAKGKDGVTTIIYQNTNGNPSTLNASFIAGAQYNGFSNPVAAATAPNYTNSVLSATNTITSVVNGISASANIINSNSISLSLGVLTTAVNGVVASTSIAALLSSGTVNTFTSSGNILSSEVNGILATSTAINSNTFTASGSILSTNVNGVVSTTSALGIFRFSASSTNNNLTLATDTQGNVTYSFTNNPIFNNIVGVNATSTNFFTSTLKSITGYVSNLFFDTATGGTLIVGNITATNTAVFNNATITNANIGNIGNIIASNTTNNISTTTNTFTSTINGLAANIISFINSFTQSVTGNILTSTVNGVVATTTIINSSSLSYSTSTQILTSNINGIISTTSVPTTTISNLISVATTGNNFILTSNVNGVISTTSTNFINSNTVSTTTNTFTNLVNGISSAVVNIINSFTQTLSGNTLTTTINGVVATSSVISGNTISYATATSRITSIINGVVATNSLKLAGSNLTDFINGRISFGNLAGGLSQSTNLFWDNTTGSLGVGSSSPVYKLDVFGNSRIQSSLSFSEDTGNGFIGFDLNNFNRKLRLSAGSSDTGDGSQGAAIDLYGKVSSDGSKLGSLNLYAGNTGGWFNVSTFDNQVTSTAANRLQINNQGSVAINASQYATQYGDLPNNTPENSNTAINTGTRSTLPATKLTVFGNINNLLDPSTNPNTGVQDGGVIQLGEITSFGKNNSSIVFNGQFAYALARDNDELITVDTTLNQINANRPLELRRLNYTTGPANVLKVSGRYAYIAAKSRIMVADIGNPNDQSMIADQGMTADEIVDMQIMGRYIYAVGKSNDILSVVDITRPERPREASQINTISRPTSIEVQGKYAYVSSTDNAQVQAFDISNPNSPVSLGITNVNSPSGSAISGRYLYTISENNKTVDVTDLQDPNALANVSTLNLTEQPKSIVIAGRYAYIAAINKKLYIVDIEDINNISLAKDISLPINASSLAIKGKKIILTGDDNIVMYDVAGIETSNSLVHSLETGSLSVRENISAFGKLDVSGGINVGSGGIFSGGDVGISGRLALGTNELSFNGNAGASGDVLMSNGANANPNWQPLSGFLNNFISQNGNTFGTTMRVGSIDSQPLQFMVANATVATFDTAGRFGLGVLVPTAQLDTSSGVRFRGLTNSNTNTSMLTADASGNLFTRSFASLIASSTTNTFTIAGNIATSTVNGVVATNTIIKSNALSFSTSTNLVTSNVNGVITTATLTLWSLTGNASTSALTNYIGTSDQQNLSLRTNGIERIALATGTPTVINVNQGVGSNRLAFNNTLAGTNLFIGSNTNDFYWQSGFGNQTQYGSYHGIDISGGRATAAAPATLGGTGNAFNTRILNTVNQIGLVVQAGLAIPTTSATEIRNSAGVAQSVQTFSGLSLNATGTALTPSYSFQGNTSTGIYAPNTNQIGLTTAGVLRVTVSAIGNVGVGTTTPGNALTVSSSTGSVSGIRLGINAGTATTTANNKALTVNASGDIVLVDSISSITNSISTTTNTFTSTINGVASAIINFINSFTQSVTGNTLTTIINGVTATTSIISTNTITYSTSTGAIVSNINGVISTTTIVDASTSTRGLVNTSAQTFLGTKIFNDGISISSTTNVGNLFNIVGTSSRNILRISQVLNDPLDTQRVTIGQGGIASTIPDGLARDQLYVFGRINSSWNMVKADFLGNQASLAADGNLTEGMFYDFVTGGSYSPIGIPGISGASRISTNATINTAGFVGAGGILQTQLSLNPVMETRVIVNNAASRAMVGFSDRAVNTAMLTDTDNFTNEAMFRKNAAGTAWEAVTRAGAAETLTTTVLSVNVFRNLRIEMDGVLNRVLFIIDGTVVATHTTAVPAGATRLGYDAGITTTAAAAASMDLDFVRVWSDDPAGESAIALLNASTTEEAILTASSSAPSQLTALDQSLSNEELALTFMGNTTLENLNNAKNLFNEGTPTLFKYGNYLVQNTKLVLEKLSNIYIDTVLWVRGIKADKVETKKLCIEDVCVDKAQLQQLLNNVGNTAAQNASSTNTGTVNNNNTQ